MLQRLRPLQASLMLLLVSIAVFAAAVVARLTFLPDVLPIAAMDDPQPLWALEAAFLLRAIENIAALGAVVVLAAVVAHWAGARPVAPEH
jgi:hypothetical protein